MNVAKVTRKRPPVISRLLCLVGLHWWVYGSYSDAEGTSLHRDCPRCGLHVELLP